MERGATKDIWRIERNFFICPYIEISRLHQIVWNPHACKWLAINGVFIQDGHPIVGENTLKVAKIIVTLFLFLRVPCLNFNHVIIMKDFHNVFAYYGRSKPK